MPALRFKTKVSKYVRKLPIMGREDPYSTDVIRFWIDVPRIVIVDARYPKLLLGWCLLRLFWRAFQQGPVGKDTP